MKLCYVICLSFLLSLLSQIALAKEAWEIEVERITQKIDAHQSNPEKLSQLTKWVTDDFLKLRPDSVMNPSQALEFGEYELILLDLIETVKTPSLLSPNTGVSTQFDCEYFLLHWQLGLQPQGETLENKPLKTLAPLIKKFCQ
jgi:hypothetical protein